MERSELQVGDVVVRNNDKSVSEVKISGVHPRTSPIRGDSYEYSIDCLTGRFFAKDLTLIRRIGDEPPALSPIITKRVIKLDKFGIVRIDQVSDSYRGVSLSIREPGYLTAEQLREAAHILNQIAEVLEENK